MLILILAFVALGLQGKPDYNGTWLLNSSKSVKAIEEGMSASPRRMTLTVTDKDVTIVDRVLGPDGKPVEVPPSGWNERTTVCAFGPTPTENQRPMAIDLCSARWNGDALVITRSRKAQPGLPASPTTIATYTIAGSELKAVGTTSLPDRKEPLTATVFWDRAK